MILLFLTDGFEEVEALTVVDVLRRAELPVVMVGVGGKTVTGSHGITVTADIQSGEIPEGELTAVILPGGPGTPRLEESAAVQSALDKALTAGCLIAAICAAPSVLGHRGLLSGRRATCFPGYEKECTGAVLTGKPVETDGNIITARGAGAAMDFALAITAYLCGEEMAGKIAAVMQCP